jgi:hypothetical protein
MLRTPLSKEERSGIAKLSENLPNEEQTCRLASMLHSAFVDIRLLAGGGDTEVVADLADAFHNLPLDLHGLSIWSSGSFRGSLKSYDEKYASDNHNIFKKYLDEFDSIFPR